MGPHEGVWDEPSQGTAKEGEDAVRPILDDRFIETFHATWKDQVAGWIARILFDGNLHLWTEFGDVEHEVWARIFAGIPAADWFTTPGSPEAMTAAWLRAVAHHCTLNYIRDHHAKHELPLYLSSPEEPDGESLEETLLSDLGKQAEDTATQAIFSRALTRVSAADRQVIELELRTDDVGRVAENLKISRGAARQRLCRAYQRVRKVYAPTAPVRRRRCRGDR